MGPQQDWKALAIKFGPGWAIAAFLVGWLVTSIAAQVKGIQTDLTAHILDHRTESQRENFWLAALCRHTAKTQDERDDCKYQEPSR